MTYALDLSPRQSARTLEQAIRHRADLLLIPRLEPGEKAIPCRLAAIETRKVANSRRACLAVVPCFDGCSGGPGGGALLCERAGPEPLLEQCPSLAGTYCDVTILLGENRYLFSSDVVGVEGDPNGAAGVRIYLSRPAILQVAQRRRFQRFRPAQSAQVELHWVNSDRSVGVGIGWLCNVCPDGLACRTEMRIADQLGIGEEFKLQFTLTPGDPEHFALDAVLCNKTPAGTQGKMILGLQFLSGPGHESSARVAQALHQRLLAKYATLVNTAEGADA